MAAKDTVQSAAAEGERLQKELAAARRERDDAVVAARAANERNERLEVQLRELRGKLSIAQEAKLPPAAQSGLQLVDSFTVVRTDTGALIDARPGDVLIEAAEGHGGAEARAMQAALGEGWRVWPVSRQQLDELTERGCLRS